MSEHALDLRKSVRIVRRRKTLVSLAAALGLLGGAAYSFIHPPLLTSTALVVLPGSIPSNQASAGQSAISPYTATQMVIARSSPVLANALPSVRPAMSLNQLRNEIQVNGLTSYIISIAASGKLAADTEATANAVANSYVAYANSSSSPIPHVSAKILQPASTAAGRSPVKAVLITGLIGALAGAIIGVIASLALGRKDRRLRERDEIAGAIGVPVLASFPTRHPTDAGGWTALLENYEPGARDAWRMRQALQQLDIGEAGHNNRSNGSSFSVAVLSLSSDPGALALGPQLAVFAASLGIRTTLVVGSQQDSDATATLRTSCAMAAPLSSSRPGNLQVIADDGGNGNIGFAGTQLEDALTVVVVVVDGRAPRMPDTMRTTATVLGVSAGKTTADQLARAAVVAAADGRDITGILVANPESTDRTTGRIPPLAQPRQRRLPTRLNGLITEIRQ